LINVPWSIYHRREKNLPRLDTRTMYRNRSSAIFSPSTPSDTANRVETNTRQVSWTRMQVCDTYIQHNIHRTCVRAMNVSVDRLIMSVQNTNRYITRSQLYYIHRYCYIIRPKTSYWYISIGKHWNSYYTLHVQTFFLFFSLQTHYR